MLFPSFLQPNDVTYDSYGRLYHAADKKYRSVTSILNLVKEIDWSKPRYYHNKSNPHYPWEKYVHDSATVGSYFHHRLGCELAEQFNLPYPEFDPEEPFPADAVYYRGGEGYRRGDLYEIMLCYWDDFKRIANPAVVHTGLEQFLYHSSGYAGRVDLVATLDPYSYKKNVLGHVKHFHFLNGEPKHSDIWVIDFKSSRTKSDTWGAQLWAYFQAWNERFPEYSANRMGIFRCNGETGWEFIESNGDRELWEQGMTKAQKEGVLNG